MKNLKTLLSEIILLVLILSSCWIWNDEDSNPPLTPTYQGGGEKIEESPISFDNPTDEEHSAYYLENDTEFEINLWWPYYTWKQKMDQLFFKEYDKLKEAKVDEIMKTTEKVFTQSLKLQEETLKYKDSYIDFISTIILENNDLADIAKESAKILSKQRIKEEVLIANYNSIVTNGKNESINAYFKYYKTYLSITLSKTVSDNLTDFIQLSSQVVSILEVEENNKWNKIVIGELEKFNKKMQSIWTLAEIVSELQNDEFILNVWLRQIETAEYYMSKGSISFIQENIPDLQDKINTLKVDENNSEEDIKFLKEYIDFYKDLSTTLNDELETNTNKNRLISINITPKDINYIEFLFPKANAEETKGYFASALSSLSSWASSLANLTKSAASFTWDTAKAGYKWTKTVIWFGAGLADTTAKSTFDVAFWIYDWQSIAEMRKDVFENFDKFEKNVEEWTAGSNLFKNAWEMLEWTEKAIADSAWWFVEDKIWKGRISWGTSWLTKMTVGMFTWLGKWIYKISDQKSTNGEVAEWYLDVWLSFIWGSKVLIKSSKVFSTTSKIKGVKDMIKNWINVLKNSVIKAEWHSLTWLWKEAIKKLWLVKWQVVNLVNNTSKETIIKAIKSDIWALKSAVIEKLKDFVSKWWWKTSVKEWLEEWKAGYSGFVKEMFEEGLEWYIKSISATIWWTADDFIDNIIWWEIDNIIKSIVKQAIDEWIIPWLEWPFDWTYKWTITDDNSEEMMKKTDITISNNVFLWKATVDASESWFTVKGYIDFKWKIDEYWVLKDWLVDWNISITAEWKTFVILLKYTLKWTLWETWWAITWTSWTITDKNWLLEYIAQKFWEWLAKAFWWDSPLSSWVAWWEVVYPVDEPFEIVLVKVIEEVKVIENTGSGKVDK